MINLDKLRETAARLREIEHTQFEQLTIGDIVSALDDAYTLAALVEELDTHMLDGEPPDEWADALREDEE